MSTSTPSPILSDAVIDEICNPLKASAAKCKHLESLGMLVKRKANGRPLVSRSEFERVMSSNTSKEEKTDKPQSTGPNILALEDFFQKRKNGTRT